MATGRQQVPVFVRVRPLNSREEANGERAVWDLTENSLSCSMTGKDTTSSFSVNKVFEQTSNTAEVFTRAAKDIVAHALQGWSGTVFAYGQTSSGKTHTMMGSGDEPGVVQMSMDYMWQQIDKDAEADYVVRCTCMEVYNERLTDLKTGVELEIKEGKNREPVLAGEAPVVVSSSKNATAEIERAMERRHMGSTNMNNTSSRSHTIFRVQIDRMPKTSKAATRSLLHLVDLAGSENVKKAGTSGQSAREGSNINQSLSALVRVIKCLTESKAGGFIPFRDSKLTRLLKASLGGNTKTSVICCVTAASGQYDQTVSTLRFAQEASKVKNDPKRCLLQNGEIPAALRKTVQALAAAQTEQAQAQYRDQLAAMMGEMEKLRAEQLQKTEEIERSLANEREKRKAAESALFLRESRENGAPGKAKQLIKRRQTLADGGLQWDPTKKAPAPKGFPAPLPDKKTVSFTSLHDTAEPNTPPSRSSNEGLSSPFAMPAGRKSLPASFAPSGRLSVGLRKDLEEVKKDLEEKEKSLAARQAEIHEAREKLEAKERELRKEEATREATEEKMREFEARFVKEIQAREEKLAALEEQAKQVRILEEAHTKARLSLDNRTRRLHDLEGTMQEREAELEGKLVQACEMAQAVSKEKDKKNAELEDEVYRERQLKLDAEMERHRLAQEMQELTAEMRNLRAANNALHNVDAEKTLLQRQAAELAQKNKELAIAEHMLEGGSATLWAQNWNKERQNEELDTLRTGLQLEITGAQEEAAAQKEKVEHLRLEINEMKSRHTAQVQLLKEEQGLRDADFTSKLEQLTQTHAEELASLGEEARAGAEALCKEREQMQARYEIQIEAERAKVASAVRARDEAVDEIKEAFAVEAKLKEKQYEEDTTELRARLAVEMREHEAKIKAWEQEYEGTVSRAREEIEELKEKHRVMREEMQENARRSEEHFAKMTREAKETAESELERVRIEADREKQAIVSAEAERVSELEGRLSASQAAHEEEISKVEMTAKDAKQRLETVVQEKIASLEASFADKVRQTEEEYDAKTSNLTDEVSRLQAAQKAQQQQAEEEKAVLTARIHRKEVELLASLEEEKAGFTRSREALETAMTLKINAVVARAEEEKKHSLRQVSDIEREKELEVQSLQQTLQKQKGDIVALEFKAKDEMSAKMRDLQAQRDATITEISSKYDSKIQSFEAEKQQLSAEIASQKAQTDDLLAQLQAAKDGELRAEREGAQKQLAEVQERARLEKAELETAFDALKASHTAELGALSAQYEQQQQALEAAKETELSTLRTSFEEALSAVAAEKQQQEDEFRSRAYELEQARLRDIGVAKEELEAERNKHNELVSQLQCTLEQARTEKEKEIGRIKEQSLKDQHEAEERYEEQVKEKSDQIASLEKQREEDLDRIRAEMASARDEAEAATKRLEDQLKTDLDKTRSEHEASKAALEAEIGTLQGDVEAQQEAHRQLNVQHADQIASLEKQCADAVELEKQEAVNRQKDLLERKMILEEERAALDKLTKEQKEELDCSMMGPLREARNQMEKQLAAKKVALSETKEEITQLRRKVAVLEADKDTLKNKLQQAQSSKGAMKPPAKNTGPSNAKLLDKIKQLESHLSTEKKEHERKLKASEEQARQQMQAMQSEFQSRLHHASANQGSPDQSSAQVSRLQQEVAAKDAALHELQAVLQAKDMEIESLREASQATSVNADNEVQRIIHLGRASLSSLKESAEKQLQEAADENGSLKSQLQEALSALSASQTEVEGLKQRQAQPSVSAAEGDSEVMKGMRKALEDQQDEAQEMLERLNARLQKAQQEKYAAITEKEALQDKFEEEIRLEKRRLRREFEKAKDKIERTATKSARPATVNVENP